MHQIIFINGYSGIGKTTLAKKLFEHYKSTYIEQYMIPEFLTKDGKTEIVGKEEDETLYTSMVVLIKNFCRLGYQNILALDFNEMRIRDIPNDFKGYDYIILTLHCSKEQNIEQMKNRGKGLIDLEMLEKDYARKQKYPRENLPNEYILDVTNKTPEQVFCEAKSILDNSSSLLEFDYIPPDRKCFGTWVKDEQND